MFPGLKTLKIDFAFLTRKLKSFVAALLLKRDFELPLTFKINDFKFSLGIFLFAIFFCSCEKVIEVDLEKPVSKYVIQGYITDQPGDCKVQITQMVNFSDSAVFPGVTGALGNHPG